MAKPRKTRSPIYVSLSEQRIEQIEQLIAGWNNETRRFVLRQLHQYDPDHSFEPGDETSAALDETP